VTGPDCRAPYLIVVDMQRIFASGPWGAPRFNEAVPVARRLVDRFAGTAVFTRFVAPARPDGAWQSYYDRWSFAVQPPDAPDYQLVDEFADRAGSTVDASTFGKWSALAGTQDFRPGDTLLVCGVSTDCCVLSTVLAAADAGMATRVVADACAGADDASHRKALDLMALYAPLVEIVESTDVLD
jgi:nicotinamidase-related amidase